ncbi:MAG: sensor histidine kinase KdpD [Oscillospiraceae bacterium]|nr:sensor histidine kinase KdpD [Oscillospiraceae bacterium]
MEKTKSSPDEILEAINREERSAHRGKLKIFFGYAAGVGKTYAMLEAAHTALADGADIVAGYVEPHPRPQTAALLDGLEVLPYKTVDHGGITLNEFDLDAAIKRSPQIILVDELAHTNADGCRHTKRYQDVEELLNAGIDVWTTVNVQHIESLNDMVASITGVTVRERIPDKVFDNADKVELVDIEPQDLIARLGEGRIYREAQAQKALDAFFTVENLTALREIALRRCADRVNKFSEDARIKNNTDYYTDEHILVCLSSSPSNQKIIRTAARMAKAFNGSFTALFVETPDFAAMSAEDKKRLRDNTHLAEQLGAKIETTYGSDIAYQISEYARLSGISKIVLGRSNSRRKLPFGKSALTEQIIEYSPNLDIYIIPDTAPAGAYRAHKARAGSQKHIAADFIKAAAVIAAATGIGYLFERFGIDVANIITVYILGVLVISVLTSNRWFSLISSLASVVVFNFFFTDPRYTLNAYDPSYPITFLVMFIAAFITSNLAAKIKQSAKQSALTAYRTRVLFDTDKLLQKAETKSEAAAAAANQLVKLLNRSVIFYGENNGELAKPQIFPAPEKTVPEDCVSANEKATAAWTFRNNKRSGATTNTLSASKCLYLAVRVNDSVYGVFGIVIDKTPLDSFENSVVLSIIGELALALENLRNIKEKEDAAVLAKNEQLRANLLRSISHDLRTPLTSISGNAGILVAESDSIDPEKRTKIYKSIYDDSLWLINLVENLLSVTRIEDGTMKIRRRSELMEEVIGEAVSRIRQTSGRKISVHQEDELLMVKIDARLIVQVVINILDNAVKYSPSDTEITVNVFRRGKNAVTEISDLGHGIPDSDKPRIFDMFYTAETKIADSRRSMGLGLALCKSILAAHGGEITVRDNQPKGTVFSFTLPAEEVTIHE